MKVCSKCKKEKDEGCFHKNKRRKDGLNESCKDCNRESVLLNAKKYRQKNQDKINATAREYYHSKGKEVIYTDEKKAYQKEYRLRSKEKLSVYAKIYREKNKEQICEYKKQLYDRKRQLYIEKARKWAQMNRDRRKNIEIDFHKRHPSKKKEYREKWVVNNPDKYREVNKKYNSRPVVKERSKAARAELLPRYVKHLLRSDGYTNEHIEQMPVLMAIKQINVINKRFNKLKKQKK